jgi:hypothetical protein
MGLIDIHIHRDDRRHHHKPKKRLFIFINSIITSQMDLILKQDKGSVTGRLIVKDQFGTELTITGASYQSENDSVFTVSGDDSSFTITPAGIGSATFTYSANGLTGTGIVVVEQAASVATTIDFEITSGQQP